MAVNPGTSTRLNYITGYSSSVPIKESDKVKYADTVYAAGIILHDENGFLYHTDGVKTLTQLLESPIIDKNVKILTAAERKMITDVNKAGGFVATDESNKISDDQLNLVEGGKIVESYLSKYIENGMIKLEVIPKDVRAHMKYVKTYEELASVSEESHNGMVFVMDASGDPTVNSGWAIYAWYDEDEDEGEPAGWHKIQEGEGIDYDYESITTHDSVEKVGAVMYDHTIFLKSPTLDQLAGLGDPVVTPVFTEWESKLSGYANTEIALGAKITEKYAASGEHKVVFTVTPSGTLTIKGFDDGDASDGTPKTITGEASAINAKLATIKVVPGASGGSFTMDLDDGYDVKTITVSTTPYKQTSILGASDPVAVINGNQIACPIKLATDGVDPAAQFNVTLTPTGCSMLDSGSSPVAADSPWVIPAGNVTTVNAALAAAKIVGAGTPGSIAVSVTEGSLSATLTVNVAYADPTLEGSESATAGDGAEVALGITVGTTNVDPAGQHTVVVTPTGVSLKDDAQAPVSDGTPWTVGPDTCENINTKLAAAKIVGDSDGGTVSVTLDGDKASKTITVSIA